MKAFTIQRLAQSAVLLGLVLVACAFSWPSNRLTAEESAETSCEDCGRKVMFVPTGDPVKDLANWEALNVAALKKQADLQVAAGKLHRAKMDVWQGHKITPAFQAPANAFPTHKWICDNFGDPPAPDGRKAEFEWIDGTQFRTVGWLGIIRKISERAGGWEVQIAMRPNLMSDHPVTRTTHEFLETWFVDRDGSITFLKGEPTDTPQSIICH